MADLIFSKRKQGHFTCGCLAWHEGFRQIKVASDNVILIDVVSNGYALGNNLLEVQLIHTMILKE
ncbi:hypothetical protein Goarm_012006 [Gossypium armourianum]|uniref:RNase H type-1 domain-containing protein n=1 Tax=Gossypium armourianum TaxID=34283 RepID=A0A7J9IZC8_9ROSI|nr:hypothetical protein [Gossypium armourianum]